MRPVGERVAHALYRAVLALYPTSFRTRSGPPLLVELDEGLRRAGRAGTGAVVTYAAGELLDLVKNLPAAWREARTRDRRTTGMRWGIWQDVVWAARSLAKRPGLVATVVLTLGLAIGANATVFGVVDGVLLEPLPYEEPDELVYMIESFRGDQTRSVSYLNYRDWQTRNRSFEALGARTGWSFTLTGEGEALPVDARLVSANLPGLLGVQPETGRMFTTEEALDGERVVLLSGELWRGRFGSDPRVVGRTVRLDDVPYTVVGVLPPGLEFPLDDADVYAPLSVLTPNDRDNRGSHPGISVVGRLRAGSSLDAARRDMETVASELAEEYPETNADAGVVVRSLADRALGDAPGLLGLLAGTVALVLAIACVNVANLLLVRGRTRRREAAVRAALGAGRARIAREFLVESGLLVAAAAALGVLLALWGTGLVRALAPAGIPRTSRIEIDASVLLFTAGVSAATVLLVGLLPALRASATQPARDLCEGGRGGPARDGKLRSALVVTELALSFVLLVGGGLMLKSVGNLLDRDPGLDPEGVLTARVTVPGSRYPGTEDRARFYGRLIERLEAVPGVETAAGVDPLPLSGFNRQWSLSGDGLERVGADGLRVDQMNVTPGYFEAVGIPVLEGRGFTGRETPDDPVAVVDEWLAERLWPGQSAPGRRLRFGGADSPWMTVVGVVGHVRHYGVHRQGREQIYLPYTVNVWSLSIVVKTAGDPSAVTPALRTAVAELDPAVPVADVRTLDELFDGTIAEELLATRGLATFAAAALFLALVGLYGSVAYAVSLRTREIGIRLALGARAERVTASITRGGAGLAALGVLLGAGAVIPAARLLDGLLHGVEPLDPWILAAVAGGLMATACLATLVPALRASRVDPAESLRTE